MFTFLTALAFACLPQALASAFLRSKGPAATIVRRELVDQSLAVAFATDAAKLTELENELRPIYDSLPKSSQGTLEPAAVRYAMHRYFLQKHSWHMKGLDPADADANASSPAGILTNRVPGYIQGLFANHLHGKGFGLHELAVFAATLSDLIFKEELRKLEDAYLMIGADAHQTLTPALTHTLIESYLFKFLLPDDTNLTSYRQLKEEVEDIFAGWHDTSMWAEDLCKALEISDGSRHNPFNAKSTPAHTAVIVEEIGNRFGIFQQQECASMREDLLALDMRQTGRVLLSDFYRVGLQGVWSFVEGIDYLRHTGVLDETNPKYPAVIIPNYIASPSNCVGSSSFFSACCRNECEGLMARLERELATPLVKVEYIFRAISEMPATESENTPRLSSQLVFRLRSIAQQHDGLVPIHGRLFAQWMHHAYPRECPFPQARGQQTPEEWEAANGQVAIMERTELLQVVDEAAMNNAQRFAYDRFRVEALPWHTAEALLGKHVERPEITEGLPWRKVAVILAIASLAAPLVGGYNVLLAKLPDAKGGKLPFTTTKQHLV